jgi:hypothetical protein
MAREELAILLDAANLACLPSYGLDEKSNKRLGARR